MSAVKRNVLLGAALCLLLACNRGPSPVGRPLAKKAHRRLRAVIVPKPQSLIPQEGQVFVDGQFTEMIFNNLVKANHLGHLAPELARSWEISPDQREYTFHLRQNVSFHDGRPFTAADVVFSLEQLMRKAQGKYAEVFFIEGCEDFLAGRSASVRGLQPLDDLTLRIRLNENFKFFLEFLSAEYTAILPRDYAGMDAAAFRQRPIGTGPFRLIGSRSQSVGGREFTVYRLERHRGYFAPAGSVEAIDFYTASTDIAAADLEHFDILFLNNRKITEAAGRHDFQVINSAPSIINFLVLNPAENSQMRDPRLRQLIHHAIDREELVDKVFRRQAVPAHSMMPYGLLGHNPYYRIDYSLAATIRAELPPGRMGFTILTVAKDERQKVAEFVSRSLARFNIEVQVITVTDQYDYFTNRIYHAGTSVMLGGIPDFPSSYHFLSHLVEPSGYYNIFGFSFPGLRKRIRELPGVSMIRETQNLAEIGAALENEALYIPLYYSSNFYAVRRGIRNIAFTYGEVIDFSGLEVVE